VSLIVRVRLPYSVEDGGYECSSYWICSIDAAQYIRHDLARCHKISILLVEKDVLDY